MKGKNTYGRKLCLQELLYKTTISLSIKFSPLLRFKQSSKQIFRFTWTFKSFVIEYIRKSWNTICELTGFVNFYTSKVSFSCNRVSYIPRNVSFELDRNELWGHHWFSVFSAYSCVLTMKYNIFWQFYRLTHCTTTYYDSLLHFISVVFVYNVEVHFDDSLSFLRHFGTQQTSESHIWKILSHILPKVVTGIFKLRTYGI